MACYVVVPGSVANLHHQLTRPIHSFMSGERSQSNCIYCSLWGKPELSSEKPQTQTYEAVWMRSFIGEWE